MTQDEDEDVSPTSVDRKPYERPRLVEYGSIAKLTQGSRTILNDGGAGMRFMICL